jgi:hypothetical protein
MNKISINKLKILKLNNNHIQKNIKTNTNTNIKTNTKNIYFIFSSISFLQLYLPIINYCNKKNIHSVFFTRKNSKQYTCPITNKSNNIILNDIIKKYNIEIKKLDDIVQLNKDILFVVDGDIYGPNEHNKVESILFRYNINKNVKIISLCEHLNFLWAYNKFIDKVNYVIFPNNIFPKFYNFVNNKNIFLGNTKFDDIPEKDIIYRKYNLNTNDKYILFLYPKAKYIESYTINSLHIKNLFNIFRIIGYKIIVKTRPKDIIFLDCKGDYNIISDCYPNESLELMKISELCIYFSSSAIDECVMSEIPMIDFVVDNHIEKRLEFLYDERIICQIKNWKNISQIELTEKINNLEKKNNIIFKEIKEKYMYTHNNSAEKIFNYFLE